MKKAWPACVLLGIMLMIMLVMGVFETNRLAHNNASAESLSEYDHHGMFLFDFGNGPVAEGYLPVTNNMIYDPERGYGINKNVIDIDMNPPESPTGLAIESILSNQILISWTEVEDALFYYVYRTRFNPDYFKGTEINTFERIGVTSLPTFTDDDIHSPNPYYYVVRAVNAGGMSEPSEILVANERAQSRLKPCGSGPSHAQVIRSGHKWKSIGRGKGVIYSGNDMLEAMQAAVDSLTPDRTWQEKVVVRGSGTISGDRSLDLPSYTIFEVCGTIHVEGTGDPFSYDNHTAAVRISHAEHISIPYLNITGNPNFGIFIRTSEHIHLGQIDLRLNGGLGIRIDSRDNDDVYGVRHVRIDDVFVSGTSSHGVETYGVDGIEIGTVTAVHTGYSGLLLNDTINASVDIVYGYEAGAGTGYAAFRMANRAGHLDDDYTTNIYVGEVIARGGGRGLFTVSRSGGAVIERVDIARTGNNAILIENGHNIAITGGIVEGPNNIRLAARSEFPNNTNILFENLTVRNSSILEQPCGINTQFKNITLQNSTMNVCQ